MASNVIAIPNVQGEGRPWVATLHDWVTTVDHKRIGLLYILSAFLFLAVAGVEALVIRIQLMYPHNDFVSPQAFNRLFTMHGTTMIFFFAMPVLFGFANYLVPLMIGSRDMAFPRLNAFSLWLTAFGGLLLYFSFIGGSGLYGAGNAPDVGWWAYAPLALKAFHSAGRSRRLTRKLDDLVGADTGISSPGNRDPADLDDDEVGAFRCRWRRSRARTSSSTPPTAGLG